MRTSGSRLVPGRLHSVCGAGRTSAIQIVNVELTGAMNSKEVVVQPSFVVDDSAVTGAGSGSSYFVYQPPRIVR